MIPMGLLNNNLRESFLSKVMLKHERLNPGLFKETRQWGNRLSTTYIRMFSIELGQFSYLASECMCYKLMTKAATNEFDLRMVLINFLDKG